MIRVDLYHTSFCFASGCLSIDFYLSCYIITPVYVEKKKIDFFFNIVKFEFLVLLQISCSFTNKELFFVVDFFSLRQ